MPEKGKIGRIVETKFIRGEEVSLEWRIRDFPSLSGRFDDHYNSPKFRFNNECWFMSIRMGLGEKVRVSLIRNDSDEDPTESFSVEMGIKGPRGIEIESEAEWFSYSNSGPTDAWLCTAYFCSRSELMRQKSRLLPQGLLTIMCIMKNIEPLDARGESSQRDRNLETGALTGGKQSLVKRDGEKANEDFAKLLASGENSDVTVQVGGVEFSVHRAILSARSPVLSAMFQKKTLRSSKKKAKLSNEIVIEDCEPGIFKDFLHYIYAGSVQLLTEQNVFELYRIANKYLADNLKLQCLEYLEDTLCIQTFCDTVKFAFAHEENDLLEQAVDFASQNIKLIIRSKEWQNFIEECPAKANEILIQSLGPLS